MFAGRFRECAARALLLPRRRPDRRTPLWQQRQRAADLLQVASRYPDFPILLETTRECLNDVFDLPALREVLTDLRARRVRMVAVDTPRASPFAQSLLFGWIAVYMYEGDAPLAERRAAALALDRDLLRELLGAEELRELVDPAVLADLELELQRLADGRRARDADEVHDLLRLLGPLGRWEVEVRTDTPDPETASAVVGEWLEQLVRERRAIAVNVAGEERLAAAEDAARLRDALGVALPPGLPAAFTDPVPEPLVDLVARFARTHGPFLTGQVAARYGVGVERVLPVLEKLEADGRIVRGEFRPDGIEREWCDDDVLRQLRRRSLAALRREVEPVEGDALARFLPEWQGVGSPRRGLDAVVEAVGALQGLALPASVLRVRGPRRPRRRLPARRPRRPVHGGRAGLGRRRHRSAPATAGSACSSATRPACWWRRRTRRPSPRSWPTRWRRPCTPTWATGVRRSGPTSSPPPRPRASPTTTPPCSTRSGPSSGPACHQRLARPPARPRRVRRPAQGLIAARVGAAQSRRSRTVGRRPNLGRPAVGSMTRLGPPAAAGAGRSSPRCSSRDPPPPRRPTPRPCSCSSATASSPARPSWPRGSRAASPAVYPVLKALEERGHVRRGYFVAGLGGAQFALPGAVDRLRATREVDQGDVSSGPDPDIVVLAATDPAQPYGAALPWPESSGRPARAAGAVVVLAGGAPVAYLERGGRSLVVFPAAEHHPRWAAAVAGLVGTGRSRLELARIDGEPAGAVPARRRPAGGGLPRRLPGPRPRRPLRRSRCPRATPSTERRPGCARPSPVGRSSGSRRPARPGRGRRSAPWSPGWRPGASTCSCTSTTGGPSRPTCA